MTLPDDMVDDTPRHEARNCQGGCCPADLDTCTELPGLDPVDNYMSEFLVDLLASAPHDVCHTDCSPFYTVALCFASTAYGLDNTCRTEFTEGQMLRMRAQYEVYRKPPQQPTASPSTAAPIGTPVPTYNPSIAAPSESTTDPPSPSPKTSPSTDTLPPSTMVPQEPLPITAPPVPVPVRAPTKQPVVTPTSQQTESPTTAAPLPQPTKPATAPSQCFFWCQVWSAISALFNMLLSLLQQEGVAGS